MIGMPFVLHDSIRRDKVDNLKILADEILPVYETNTGEKIVNARELHEKMMVGKDFTSWIKNRIDQYGFTENEDYFLTLTKIGERKNVTRHDYFLTLDTAKEIAMVQNNEAGRAIRKYFIEVEKRFRQKQPQTQAELILMVAQKLVDHEREVAQLKGEINQTRDEVRNISSIVALTPNDWRSDVNKIINSIAFKTGGEKSYQDVRRESYQLLESRAKCDLDRRLTNLRKNLALEGASKTKINTANKMDVIESDKRLTEIYLAIVKEMAIKYRVDLKLKAI